MTRDDTGLCPSAQLSVPLGSHDTWKIVPYERAGEITGDMTVEDLVSKFGEPNFVRRAVGAASYFWDDRGFQVEVVDSDGFIYEVGASIPVLKFQYENIVLKGSTKILAKKLEDIGVAVNHNILVGWSFPGVRFWGEKQNVSQAWVTLSRKEFPPEIWWIPGTENM